MDELISGRRVDRQMGGWVDRWVSGCVDEWNDALVVDEWVIRLNNGWMDGE